MYQIHKSLGQHFLQDENISRKIIQALGLAPGDTLLEVGPGLGALTKYVVAMPELDYYAVEIDREKVDYLQKQYPVLKEHLWHGDILKVSLPFARPFKLVGNFPYQITSGILFRVMEWKAYLQLVVGMVQKEVALRISSEPHQKAYGLMSVLLQTWFRIEYLFDVSPGCFFPPPRVQSAVIRLMPKTERPEIVDEKQYIRLVKMAFQQRRKMLRNALKNVFPVEMLQQPIFGQRAEELGWEDYLQLYQWYRQVNS